MHYLNSELCKGCLICIAFCPKGVYEFSDNQNKKGVRIPAPVNIDQCSYCNLCELMCPDQALKVEKDE